MNTQTQQIPTTPPELETLPRATAHELGDEAKLAVHRAAEAISKPAVGATVAGAAVLAAGAMWGATEAALAAVAAYAVFRMLRRRRDRSE